MKGRCAQKRDGKRFSSTASFPRRRRESNHLDSGLPARGSAYSPRLPVLANSGFLRLSSPLTAAGPRRLCTSLPCCRSAGIVARTRGLSRNSGLSRISCTSESRL